MPDPNPEPRSRDLCGPPYRWRGKFKVGAVPTDVVSLVFPLQYFENGGDK